MAVRLARCLVERCCPNTATPALLPPPPPGSAEINQVVTRYRYSGDCTLARWHAYCDEYHVPRDRRVPLLFTTGSAWETAEVIECGLRRANVLALDISGGDRVAVLMRGRAPAEIHAIQQRLAAHDVHVWLRMATESETETVVVADRRDRMLRLIHGH